ncbi:Lsr2 family protein, partial [Micrococcus luteus]|nr:Lsr2 family protein [Micrococcus luteus]
PARRSSSSGVDASTVRLWAVENGFDVKDRGRIPVEVMDAYRNRGKKG